MLAFSQINDSANYRLVLCLVAYLRTWTRTSGIFKFESFQFQFWRWTHDVVLPFARVRCHLKEYKYVSLFNLAHIWFIIFSITSYLKLTRELRLSSKWVYHCIIMMILFQSWIQIKCDFFFLLSLSLSFCLFELIILHSNGFSFPLFLHEHCYEVLYAKVLLFIL